MKKFTIVKSIPSYLPIVNIDTDMIIPKQFLKTIKRTGLGKNLFYEMRYDQKGNKINNLDKTELLRINDIHDQYFNGIDLDSNKKVDSIFINYNDILNQKLGHIQK